MKFAPALLILLTFLPASAWAVQAENLVIGDSQLCQTFGGVLDAELREDANDSVVTRGRWGTSPHNWYDGSSTTDGFFDHDPGQDPVRGTVTQTPLFPGLLTEVSPTLVVVELGANLDWALDQNPDFINQTVDRMVSDILAAHAECFWIGPADSRLRPRMPQIRDRIIAGIAGRCVFFDSLKVTSYPADGGDGLHYDSLGPAGIAMGRDWALAAHSAIRSAFPAHFKARSRILTY
jgi:hypothetical protein